MRQAVLYICYYNVTEPLVQSQVVGYLRELAQRDFEIHLLTFEKDRFDTAHRRRICEDLALQGIRWHALRYHGWPSLPATLYDIALGGLKALNLCAKYEIPLIHGRSHVGAAIGLPVKLLRGGKLLFDVRGLLADEYVDAGRWTRASIKYRLTKVMERILFNQADAFVMLTNTIKAHLVSTEPALKNRAGDVEVIPCCAHTVLFTPDPKGRQAERLKRGWNGRRVLVSVGKLGTWYLVEEMARFFAMARQEDGRFFLQVLTQSDSKPMRLALEEGGVPPEAYDIRFAECEEVPRILGAADAGLSLIRSCYSKQASSPTRVAEYLAAGLPVISTSGIGDCDEILAQPNLGVTITRLEDGEYRRAARALIALLNDPATPRLCRDYAERELSLGWIGGPRYASVYDRLFANVEHHLARASHI